jgi:phthiodiolone/phenolphthiodiolone dimycocerosates ketoreductase
MRPRFCCMPLAHGDPDTTVRWAVLAEKCGFEAIALVDHLFHPLEGGFFAKPAMDVWISLASIGAMTKRVDLIPVVTDPIRRHPATTAHAAATLDQYTKGRALLGLGCGERFNLSPLGMSSRKPVSILEEAIKVIRELLESTKDRPANFQGTFFKIRNAYLGIELCRKPRLPIYVAGWLPRTRMLAGSTGDGWIPWAESPETFRQGLEDVKRGASFAGKKADDLILANELPTAICADSEEAWRVLAPACKRILAIRGDLLHRLGLEFSGLEKIRMNVSMLDERDGMEIAGLANLIPTDIVRKIAIGGTPEEAIEQLEEFRRAGVNEFILAPVISEFESTVKMYAKHIIPYFREI